MPSKTSCELNQIIDHDLPHLAGWSRFEFKLNDHAKQTLECYYRDPAECIEALYGNPVFAEAMKYAHEMHFTDETKKKRVYNEMNTGNWWWRTQVSKGSLKMVRSQMALFNHLEHNSISDFGESHLPMLRKVDVWGGTPLDPPPLSPHPHDQLPAKFCRPLDTVKVMYFNYISSPSNERRGSNRLREVRVGRGNSRHRGGRPVPACDPGDPLQVSIVHRLREYSTHPIIADM